jgi:hypothetical protein
VRTPQLTHYLPCSSTPPNTDLAILLQSPAVNSTLCMELLHPFRPTFMMQRGLDFRTAIRQMYALSLQSTMQGQVVSSVYLFWRCLSPLHLTYAPSLPS